MLDRISATPDPRPMACYILYRNGRCLMESRPDCHKLGLNPYWIYPGGKIEPDELAGEAAARECIEELGIQPAGIYPLQPITGPNGWVVVPRVFTYWEGDIPSHTLDHHRSPLAWFPPYTMMGQPDGNTCVREIANQLVRQIGEIEKVAYMTRRVMAGVPWYV